jgi:hypothetical protein
MLTETVKPAIASHPYRWESEPQAKPTSYLLTLELMPRRPEKLPAPMKLIEVIIPEPPTHQMEREILDQAGLDYWKWSVLTRRLEAIA